MLTAVFKNKIFKFNVSFIIIFDTLSFPMSYLSNIKSQLTGIQTVTKTPSRSSGDIRCLLLGKDILHVHIHLKLCASFCRRRVETKSENKRQSQIIILPVLQLLQIPAILLYHHPLLTFQPLPQPKLVLYLAIPEGCKAELI